MDAFTQIDFIRLIAWHEIKDRRPDDTTWQD